MTDDSEYCEPGDPVRRRDFLKLGVTGVTGAWFDEEPFEGHPLTGPAALVGSERKESVVSTGAESSFLPPVAPVLSVDGLDSARSFALSSVVSDLGIERRPVSVRELVTPQTESDLTNHDGPHAEWDNWLEDHHTEGTIVGTELSSVDDHVYLPRGERRSLVGSVVETARGKFRGVGSGHSHSEAAKPRDGFNDLKEIDGELRQPDRWLKENPPGYGDDADPIDPHHLVRLGAGTTIKLLNRGILPNKDPPLALPNMGSWDGQTLAGAINTSTHGTGLGLGTLADLVRSVEIITVPEAMAVDDEPLVRMLRVEPSDGITEPVAFAKDAHRHDMTLIQDDDLFHSVVVGYGSMGIVYGYTIECREAFWLHEEMTVTHWNDVNPEAEARRNRHFNMNVLLATESDNPRCQVKRRWKEDRNGRQQTERTDKGQSIDEFIESLPQQIVDAVLDDGIDDELLTTIVPNDPTWDPDPPGDDAPAPFRNERFETASHIALRRRYARHPNDPKMDPEKPQDVITLEVNVPVSNVEPAVEAVIDYVQRSSRWFPVPLGVRFTAGSEHYLSPEYGREDGTAMLELGIPVLEIIREVKLGGTNVYTGKKLVAQKAKLLLKEGGQDHMIALSAAKRELEHVEDMLVDRFDGRPHMGKHNTIDTNSSETYMRPQEMYDEYDTWLAAHRYVNHFGTFDADFTDNKVQ